jgi:hypothetical protein
LRTVAGERRAARLPSGQSGGFLLAGQTEPFQQIAGPVPVFIRFARDACLHIGQRGREPGQVRLLWQITDRGPGLDKSAAAIRRLLEERPAAIGLAVPGMPAGSPGMEGGTPRRYDVVLFGKTDRQPFMHFVGAEIVG